MECSTNTDGYKYIPSEYIQIEHSAPSNKCYIPSDSIHQMVLQYKYTWNVAPIQMDTNTDGMLHLIPSIRWNVALTTWRCCHVFVQLYDCKRESIRIVYKRFKYKYTFQWNVNHTTWSCRHVFAHLNDGKRSHVFADLNDCKRSSIVIIHKCFKNSTHPNRMCNTFKQNAQQIHLHSNRNTHSNRMHNEYTFIQIEMHIHLNRL